MMWVFKVNVSPIGNIVIHLWLILKQLSGRVVYRVAYLSNNRYVTIDYPLL